MPKDLEGIARKREGIGVTAIWRRAVGRFRRSARSSLQKVKPPATEGPREEPVTTYEYGVLLLIGLLIFGAIAREVLVWGPTQGCWFVFAGIGFGC